MRQKECPSCGIEIDKNYNLCPICRYEFPTKSKLNIKIIAVILILLFTYPLIKLFINLINR